MIKLIEACGSKIGQKFKKIKENITKTRKWYNTYELRKNDQIKQFYLYVVKVVELNAIIKFLQNNVHKCFQNLVTWEKKETI